MMPALNTKAVDKLVMAYDFDYACTLHFYTSEGVQLVVNIDGILHQHLISMKLGLQIFYVPNNFSSMFLIINIFHSQHDLLGVILKALTYAITFENCGKVYLICFIS